MPELKDLSRFDIVIQCCAVISKKKHVVKSVNVGRVNVVSKLVTIVKRAMMLNDVLIMVISFLAELIFGIYS